MSPERPVLLGAAEIRRLAAELGLRPAKSLGQNFVHDGNTVRRIVAVAGVGTEDHVLEVGPGLGSLTLALLEAAGAVTAVEVDPRLARRLPATVAVHVPDRADALTVITADALTLRRSDLQRADVGSASRRSDRGQSATARSGTEPLGPSAKPPDSPAGPLDPSAKRPDPSAGPLDPSAKRPDPPAGPPDLSAKRPDPPAGPPDLSAKRPGPSAKRPDPSAGPPDAPTALVANLPYNVAVPVLLHLLEEFPSLRRVLVMVQAEVADRLAAPPGSRTYGAPSAKAAWYGTAARAGSVGRAVFWPVPGVDSALVALDRHPEPLPGDRAAVFAVVDAAFAQRRKTLRSALSGWAGSAIEAERVLRSAGVDPGARGEQLDVGAFARIAAAGAPRSTAGVAR